VLVVAPVGDAPRSNYTCGIGGFLMNELGECPQCKLKTEESGRDVLAQLVAQGTHVFDQVSKLFDGADRGFAR